MILTFIILAVAIVLFITEWVAADIVALLAMTALLALGILTPPEALAGFSDPVILMIAGLFVVGEALRQTGVTQKVGGLIIAGAGNSEVRVIVLMMLAAGCLGAFMSSTGVVAMFIPVAMALSQKTGLKPSRLMMPLAVASMISGMLTLVATAPNLVVSAEIARTKVDGEYLDGFSFLSVTPFGVTILIGGIIIMATIGRRILASLDRGGSDDASPDIKSLMERYALQGVTGLMRIPKGNAMVGTTLADSNLREVYGLHVVSIRRKGRPVPARGDRALADGDELVVMGYEHKIDDAVAQLSLIRVSVSAGTADEIMSRYGMAEIMVPDGSAWEGRTIRELQLPSSQGLVVMGMMHGTTTIGWGDGLLDRPLESGERLLVSGAWKRILALKELGRTIIMLTVPREVEAYAPNKARAAVALMAVAVMVVLMVTGWTHNVTAVLLATAMVILGRCIPEKEVYGTMGWSTLVLIAAMIPVATALQKTGGTDLLVEGLVWVAGGGGPLLMKTALFVVTAGLGMFVSNTAIAVLMAPIAIGVALDGGHSPHNYAMVVMLAASAAFLTPVSSPVNTLVLGPGGYRFSDFMKVGVFLVVLVYLVAMFMVPLFYPTTG